MNYNPNILTQRYVQVAAQYGGLAETRSAYRNQDSGIYLRMMDKHSYWGFDNGLRSMIPSALHLSITGYHFILPDMIGKCMLLDIIHVEVCRPVEGKIYMHIVNEKSIA